MAVVNTNCPSKRELKKVSAVNAPALNAFREKLILKSYSINTQRTYYYEFAQFLYILGNHNVNSLDEERIRSYFLYCAETLLMKESQINSRYNAIKFYYEQVLGKETVNPSALPTEAELKEIPAAHYAVAYFEKDYDGVEAWTDFFFEAIPKVGYAPDYEHGFFFEYYPDGANGNYELWTPVVKADV